jgi:hypothetical protein
MLEMSLGRFGDRRLEKGGPFCCRVLWRAAVAGFGFAAWVGRAPERSV